MITSGIRLGTPACTTRGFGSKEFELIGSLISKVIKGLSDDIEGYKEIKNILNKGKEYCLKTLSEDKS